MTTPSRPEGFGHLEVLNTDECLVLLRSKRVGRVAWSGIRGPQVMPVNYVVDDEGRIMFRTSSNSGIAKALYEAKTAFQVDEADEYLEAGWSVLVVGTATYLHDPKEIPDDMDARPRPWASGERTMYIRIEPEEITGRRVIAA